MPVSLRRSILALRVICLTLALGSICCTSLQVASAQAPAPAPIAAAAQEKPPKEMTEGVKADGTTKVDLSVLRGKNTKGTQLWSAVAPMFTDTNPPTQQQLDNLDTFAVWRLAELTWPANPSDPRSTPEYRRMYMKFREVLKASGSDETKPVFHDRVNAVLLANLPALINDKEYSLTARYNAMLLLGQLDQIEADGTKQRVGVPLASAEPLLIAASQSSALPEVLRVAAFIGLARHADMQMLPGNRKAIADEALKMLSASAPPPGISETGLQWIRKLSMQIVIGMAQRNVTDVNRPDFVKSIVAILENENQPLFLRRDAALTLGYYDPATISSGGRPEAVLKGMTNLTLAVMKAGMSRENPGAPADLRKGEDVLQTPTDATRKNFAESVSYYLNCIAMGLGGRTDTKGTPLNKGLAKVAGPSAAQVPKLLKPIDDVVNVMSKSTTRAEEMTSKLASAHQEVEKFAIANNLLAAPAVAVPQPGAGGNGGAPVPAGGQPGAGQNLPAPVGPVLGVAPR